MTIKQWILLSVPLAVGLFFGMIAAPADLPAVSLLSGLGWWGLAPLFAARLVQVGRQETMKEGLVILIAAAGLTLIAGWLGSMEAALSVATACAVMALTSTQVSRFSEAGEPLALMVVGVLSSNFVSAAEYYQHSLSLRGIHDLDLLAILGGSLAVAAVILATLGILSERYHSRSAEGLNVEAAFRYPAPTSGILPLVIAFAVLNGVSAFFESTSSVVAFTEASMTTSNAWLIIQGLIIVVTFFAFTALFNPARAMRSAWQHAAEVAGFSADIAEHLDCSRRRAMWTTVGYLLLLAGVYEWAGELPAALGVVAISFVTSVAFDIFSEIEFRREHGFYVTVSEPSRLWEIAHIRGVLEARDIPVFVRGKGLRTMLRILGFWSDLEIMVPGDRFEQAQKLVDVLAE